MPHKHYAPTGTLLFYGGPLSSFAQRPTRIVPGYQSAPADAEPELYNCREVYFQAAKATNRADHDWVCEADRTSTWKAKERGNDVLLRDDWEQIPAGFAPNVDVLVYLIGCNAADASAAQPTPDTGRASVAVITPRDEPLSLQKIEMLSTLLNEPNEPKMRKAIVDALGNTGNGYVDLSSRHWAVDASAAERPSTTSLKWITSTTMVRPIDGRTPAHANSGVSSATVRMQASRSSAETATTPRLVMADARITTPAKPGVKYDVMLAGIRAEVAQHADFREYLASLAGRRIEEDSPTDVVWGIKKRNDGSGGLNLLGMAFMQVVAELNGDDTLTRVLYEEAQRRLRWDLERAA